MKVRIANPCGSVAAESLGPAPAPVAGRRLKLGLLDNGKPNARLLLEQTAAAMARRSSIVDQVIVAKEHAAGPCDADLLAKLAAGFDVVLTGSGD